MNLKKTIALVLACVLCLALFAACGKSEAPIQEPSASEQNGTAPAEKPASEEPATDEPSSEGMTTQEATPLQFEDLAGNYVSGRCNITVETGENNEVKISVHWGGSAFESYDWTMSGDYDADTWRVNYTNGVKTLTVFDESGNEVESKTEYEDGYGRIQFVSANQLVWQDEYEQENLVDMTFVKE